MNPHIFIALSTFGEYGDEPIRLLKDAGIDYTVNDLGKRLAREEIVERGSNSIGIIAGVEPYDALVLEKLPQLKCISRCGVGLENIDLQLAKERGISILNTPDVVIQPVVELTLAMIFDLLRKTTYHTELLRRKKWEKSAGNLLKGKTAGILGLGRIGKRVSETLKMLGVEVVGTDLYPDREWAKQNKVGIVSLDKLLLNSDIVSIHLSSIKGQAIQLGAKEFSLMKRGSFVINVSRGQFIDEPALYDSLVKGHLKGAALDVFSEEPYKGNLCELPNVVLTPHIATLTEESRQQMETEAVRNMIGFIHSHIGR